MQIKFDDNILQILFFDCGKKQALKRCVREYFIEEKIKNSENIL